MVRKSDMNWNFKIRDAMATRSKHSGRIRRLQEREVKYSEVIDYYTEQNLLSDLYGSTWFQLRYARKKQKLTKTLVKEIKARVNYMTRTYIQRGLEYNGYPKSWDTAFYMRHKTRVDALMKRIAKQLVRYATR